MAVLCAGKDATEDFEEIGHSNAAKDLLNKYAIGDYEVCPPIHNTVFEANAHVGNAGIFLAVRYSSDGLRKLLSRCLYAPLLHACCPSLLNDMWHMIVPGELQGT